MKRLLSAAILLLTVILAFNACGKNNPAAPATPVPTAAVSSTNTGTATISQTHTISPTVTETATLFVPPTSTETHTVSPTSTVTPTFTVTCTETPFIIDDFNDNDLINNIDVPSNQWDSFVNTPDAASNTYTIMSLALYSGFQSYGLQVQAVSLAENPDGSGNYFTYYGLTTPVFFAPATGINFTIYSRLIFELKAYIWNLPATYIYKYKVKLFDNTGRYAEQEISGLTVNDQSIWNHVSLDISSFSVPIGAPYVISDVLPNVVRIRWEYSMLSTVSQESCESFMNLDNILLEK